MAHHKKEEHHKKERHEHEKKEHHAKGGRVGVPDTGDQNKGSGVDEPGTEAYSGGSSNVVKEAKDRTDEFKKGGKVHGKKGRKHFARGGRASSPFSSAYVKGIKGDAR